ncbi:MAG: hypothetical protein ACFBSC_05040 [Microcoleaceae cyanobacterium]
MLNRALFPKALVTGILLLSLLLSSCSRTISAPPESNSASGSEATRTEQVQAQQPETAETQPVATKPVSGGKFNPFFPGNQADYTITFRQEKQGFSQAKLSQNGTDLAKLSINDVANNPMAANKFQDSKQTIAGYPAATQGKTTAVLVGDRYQVKVISDSDTFTADDRQAWIEQFDLTGLAQLK